MTGILKRKEKSAASSRERPQNVPAASVTPLRDSPGSTASACAAPTANARAGRERAGRAARAQLAIGQKEQQRRQSERRPQPFAAEKEAIDRVAEQHPDEGRREGRPDQPKQLPARAAEHFPQAARIYAEDGEQRPRVQHDAEEEPAPVHAEDALEQQQMPARRDGQKFRQPLHDAEHRRLPQFHVHLREATARPICMPKAGKKEADLFPIKNKRRFVRLFEYYVMYKQIKLEHMPRFYMDLSHSGDARAVRVIADGPALQDLLLPVYDVDDLRAVVGGFFDGDTHFQRGKEAEIVRLRASRDAHFGNVARLRADVQRQADGQRGGAERELVAGNGRDGVPSPFPSGGRTEARRHFRSPRRKRGEKQRASNSRETEQDGTLLHRFFPRSR